MKILKIHLILILLLWVSGTTGVAQSLTLSWDGETLGDTLQVVGFITDNELVAHAVVTNNTSSSMDVKVKRTVIQNVSGSMNYFCWGDNCYPPSVDESFSPFTIGAGQSTEDEDFSGHYEPHDQFGDSFIEYKFFNVDDEEEYVKIVVQYAATVVGVEEIETTMNVFPNPAKGQLNITNSGTIDQVMVFDQTGRMVLSEKVGAKMHRLNTSGLNQGIYYIHILSAGNVSTRQVLFN